MSRYQTIPVEDDLDVDWSTRGLSPNRVVTRREKAVETVYTTKYKHSAARFGDEEKGTSRFGDSDSRELYSDTDFVFDRKNRFLDLVEHVRRLNSPDVSAGVIRDFTDHKRGGSFSPSFLQEPARAQQSVSPFSRKYKLSIMLLKPDQRGFVNKYVPADSPPKLLKPTKSN